MSYLDDLVDKSNQLLKTYLKKAEDAWRSKSKAEAKQKAIDLKIQVNLKE